MQKFLEIASLATWPVEFGRDGNALFPLQVKDLLGACKEATDVLVLSHGWNNDQNEANQLYRELLGNLGTLEFQGKAARKLIVLRVYWPSKRFAEKELIPGGAAALSDPIQPLLSQLDGLLKDYEQPGDARHGRTIEALRALIPNLEQDEQSQEEFVRLVRFILSSHVNEEEEVLQSTFFEMEPVELLRRLGRRFQLHQTKEGAASLGLLTDAHVSEQKIAAGLGNVFSGVLNGARNFLNLFTYYEMKERAGSIGRVGLHDVLRQAREAKPALRIHLCGHSFGGRLVTAAVAASAVTDQPGRGAASLILLQAAFSHNGFGQKFDGKNDGFFRSVLAGHRMNGPIVITHSRLDLAVGLAYPIASRLRNQIASGLGDARDPYGAIGRNGALGVDNEVDPREASLRPAGDAYSPFRAGRIYNLESARYITGHSEVHGKEVAAALLHAMKVD
jgi:hypothetical protein